MLRAHRIAGPSQPLSHSLISFWPLLLLLEAQCFVNSVSAAQLMRKQEKDFQEKLNLGLHGVILGALVYRVRRGSNPCAWITVPPVTAM